MGWLGEGRGGVENSALIFNVSCTNTNAQTHKKYVSSTNIFIHIYSKIIRNLPDMKYRNKIKFKESLAADHIGNEPLNWHSEEDRAYRVREEGDYRDAPHLKSNMISF